MKVDRRKKKSLQKFDFEKWVIVWKYKIDIKSGICIANPLGPNTSQSLQEVLIFFLGSRDRASRTKCEERKKN